ncbi:AMP-binding protein [Nocardia sp. NBC_01730]|uniref:AMP-binding protein n=1 Tax=Nocardia sp. NBC_01730 TaxID=2975998 RepID=UPI002E118B06
MHGRTGSPRLGPGDTLRVAVPLNHVSGITCCVVAALVTCARTVLLPTFEAAAAADLFHTAQLTIWVGVPTMHTLLLNQPRFSTVDTAGPLRRRKLPPPPVRRQPRSAPSVATCHADTTVHRALRTRHLPHQPAPSTPSGETSVAIDLSDTNVFVAGGTSGINLGIVEGFAAAGTRVAVMSRSQENSMFGLAELDLLRRRILLPI